MDCIFLLFCVSCNLYMPDIVIFALLVLGIILILVRILGLCSGMKFLLENILILLSFTLYDFFNQSRTMSYLGLIISHYRSKMLLNFLHSAS